MSFLDYAYALGAVASIIFGLYGIYQGYIKKKEESIIRLTNIENSIEGINKSIAEISESIKVLNHNSDKIVYVLLSKGILTPEDLKNGE